MNAIRALLACTVLAGAMLSTAAMADDRADVEAATGRWIDAFNRKSVSGIVALYAPDAALFGTPLSFESRCAHEERIQRMEHTIARREIQKNRKH